jgi:hypothetical protein
MSESLEFGGTLTLEKSKEAITGILDLWIECNDRFIAWWTVKLDPMQLRSIDVGQFVTLPVEFPTTIALDHYQIMENAIYRFIPKRFSPK